MKSVYVIESSDGRVKVGISKNPAKRIGVIRTQAGIVVSNQFISVSTDDAARCELVTKSEFKSSNISGEWYSVGFDEVVDFVKANIKIAGESTSSGKERQLENELLASDWAAGVSIRLKAAECGDFIFSTISMMALQNSSMASAALNLGDAELYVFCLEYLLSAGCADAKMPLTTFN